jgi:arsenate reductase
MAHGFLQSFDERLEVRSAGTEPTSQVNPKAIQVMREAGIDISSHTPHNVEQYLNEEWDYVITVCDHAKETCPVFPGKVKHYLHMAFKDPSHETGPDDFIITRFREVRDQIKGSFDEFYKSKLKSPRE